MLEEYLPDEFTMYPPSCLSEIPQKSGIYLLIQDLSSRSHPYQYIGHAGDLRERLKQHLCEDSGTFTGEKKAVVLKPEKLTDVAYFVTEDFLDWPESVPKPKKKKDKSQEKYEKECRKIVAEALEDMAKRHPKFTPVLNDRNNPSKKANELLHCPPFVKKLEQILENKPSSITLPSARGLYKENKELRKKISVLESGQKKITSFKNKQ